MGMPSFYKWLVNKYPKIVVGAVEEEKGDDDDGIHTSSPNPNGFEFDCLYLDANFIIYLCLRSDDSIDQPTGFNIFCKSMYEYIDRLFRIVRPRKLLYLAIDGVPPRAKINLQRSNCFLNAKIAEIEEENEEEIEREGKPVLPEPDSEVSDVIFIAPGAVFMHKLSKALKSYIHARIESDPGWKDIKVILSDANVPGEGEHKIMAFIRQQRSHPGYDPNTRHCLYGMDADLIMLALASHELHFSILRGATIKERIKFVHVWILREYLELDMKIDDPPETVEMDIERIIDDFIFMCFFIGNDFLPHMPTLQINEGAIDLLMTVYKRQFKSLGGYLVDMERVADNKTGFIKLERVEKFILMVGTYEENIFKKRSELQEQERKRILHVWADQEGLNWRERDSVTVSIEHPFFGTKNSATDHSEEVRLGSPGWKVRYYKLKFSDETPEDIENTRKKIVEKYTEGLVWVLQYYFCEVPSWSWFYPFHYAPFASDLKGLAQVKIKFEKGSPLKPFDQLMCFLPPRSFHVLPKPYQQLMTDEQYIIDFYPKDFDIDTDGFLFGQKVVCILPFIDELRLLTETRKLEKELGHQEAVRNSNNDDLLIVRSSNKLGSQILELNQNQPPATIDIRLSGGFSGRMRPFYEESDIIKSNSPVYDIQKDTVLCVFYDHPSCDPHLPRLLAGVECPYKTIFDADIKDTSHWRHYHGSGPPFSRNSGWLGKKKALASTSKSVGHFQHYTRTPIGDSERNWSSRSDSSSRWSNRGEHGGMADLRISESTEGFRPYGRGQPMNNYYQSSRYGSSYSRNDYRRQSYNAPRGSSDGSGSETNSRW